MGSLDDGSTCLEHILYHPWHSQQHSRDCQVMYGQATLSWDLYNATAKFLIYEQFIDELDFQASKTYVGIHVRNILCNYILRTESYHSAHGKDTGESKNIPPDSDFSSGPGLDQVWPLQATNRTDKIYPCVYPAFPASRHLTSSLTCLIVHWQYLFDVHWFSGEGRYLQTLSGTSNLVQPLAAL